MRRRQPGLVLRLDIDVDFPAHGRSCRHRELRDHQPRGLAEYRRPGRKQVARVHRSQRKPRDFAAFFGTEARIATDAPWNDNSYDPDNAPAAVWAMRAMNSAGAAWYPAVDISGDNVNVLESPWIAAGSKGQTACVMASNHDPEGFYMSYGFP
jgi:hypothetical protein